MKRKTIFLFIALIMMLLLTTAACGGSGSSAMAGSWHLEIDRSALPSMTEAEMSQAEAVINGMKFDMTLDADGTGSAVGNFTGETKEIRFRWSESDDTLTISQLSSSSTDSVVFTKKNGRLYFPVSLVGKAQVDYYYLTK